MSALALDTALGPAHVDGHQGRRTRRTARPRLIEPARSTLEDLVLGVWEDLAADSRARCPVCTGSLESDGCHDCGAQIS